MLIGIANVQLRVEVAGYSASQTQQVKQGPYHDTMRVSEGEGLPGRSKVDVRFLDKLLHKPGNRR